MGRQEESMGVAKWWMRRRWWPRDFAEYMATPAKIGQRNLIESMCDALRTGQA